MIFRTLDFFSEVKSINNFDVWTDDEITAWLTAWNNYIKNGGVRPGHPH